jgi:hypothetical protein
MTTIELNNEFSLIPSLDALYSSGYKMKNEVPMKPRAELHGSREYDIDIRRCIVKTNIVNLLLIIEDTNDQVKLGIILDILKNTIILQSKELANMPYFITQIESSLIHHKTSYNTNVIFKMLNNITKKQAHLNLHFRVINNKVSKLPPISEEDRIVIESKLSNMRYSKQIKKKSLFVIGEIVGCRDKNNNWWMAEINYIHIDVNYSGYWYYVEFKGWNLTGNIFSEWISSESFRIKKYNPRKHHLKKYNSSDNKNQVE